MIRQATVKKLFAAMVNLPFRIDQPEFTFHNYCNEYSISTCLTPALVSLGYVSKQGQKQYTWEWKDDLTMADAEKVAKWVYDYNTEKRVKREAPAEDQPAESETHQKGMTLGQNIIDRIDNLEIALLRIAEAVEKIADFPLVQVHPHDSIVPEKPKLQGIPLTK